MSMDIGENLLIAGKQLGKCLAGYRDDDPRSSARAAIDLGNMIMDAVDEIDRLRVENAALRSRLGHPDAPREG